MSQQPGAYSVRSIFYQHGHRVARRPFLTLTLGTLTAGLLSLPTFDVSVLLQQHSWDTYTPPPGRPADPPPPRWATGEPAQRLRVLEIVVQGAFANALRWDAFRQAGFAIPAAINDFVWRVNGTEYGLGSFCRHRPDGGCDVFSVGSFWGNNQTAFELQAARDDFELPGLPGALGAHIGAASHDELQRIALLQRLRGFSGPGLHMLHARGMLVVLALSTGVDASRLALEEQFFARMLESLGASAAESADVTYVRPCRHTPGDDDDGYVLVIVYILVFFYIYLTVGSVESVKSKFGLGLAAVVIVSVSMLMAIGICKYLGLVTTLVAKEVVPFLVVATGLDNMALVTKSVASTSWDVPIRFRIAQGLGRAGPQLAKSMLTMEGLLMVGAYSRIPALQQFCIVGSVGVLTDFFLEITIFASVLSLDLRRLGQFELTELTRASQVAKPPAASIEDDFPTASMPWNNLLALLVMMSTAILALLSGGGEPRLDSFGWAERGLVYNEEHADWGFVVVNSASAVVTLPVPLDDGGNDDSLFWRMYLGEFPLWIPKPLRSNQAMLGCMVAGALLSSALYTLISYLRWQVFGERVWKGVDAVEAFGVVQSFDVRTFSGHRQDIECLTLVREPESAESEGMLLVSACLGGQIRLWSTRSQRCLQVYECSQAHSAPWSLAAWRNLVAVGFGDGRVEVIDCTGQYSVVLPAAGPPPGESRTTYDGGGVTVLAFCGNDLFSASSTGVVQRWSLSMAVADPAAASVQRDEAQNQPLDALDRGVVKLRRSSSFEFRDGSGCPTCDSHGDLAAYFGRGAQGASDLRSAGRPAVRPKRGSFSGESFTGGAEGCATSLALSRTHTEICHRAGVHAMVVTAKLVITASADRLVKVLDKELLCRFTLYGHEKEVTALDIAGDTDLVSGSADCTARVWDVTHGVCRYTLKGHTDAVLCVKINAVHVVTNAEDDTIRVWLLKTGACTRVLQNCGPMDMLLHPSSVLVTASEGALSVWDLLGRGELLRSIPLIDDETVPLGMRTSAGSSVTNHLELAPDQNTVVCDVGRNLALVELPFPRATSKIL